MSNEAPTLVRWLASLPWISCALLLLSHCDGQPHESTGGETHFLRTCDSNSTTSPCGNSLGCVCDVCTIPCNGSGDCEDYPGSVCVGSDPSDSCGASPAVGRCDVECVTDADCTYLSASHECDNGTCRAPTSVCERGQVEANELLVIGDSFFAIDHRITAYVEELARADGAISTGERYRDNSSLVANSLAAQGNGLEQQYTDATAESSVQVVLMTGGGADILSTNCDATGPGPDCPALANAADAAARLLARMADDGVRHVVYVFYPDPVPVDVRARVEALRLMIQSVCDAAPLPCHFVDLNPAFVGHRDYLQADGIFPSPAGSQASAAVIWATMRRYCIAQ